MQSSVRDVTQTTPGMIPRQQAEEPSATGTVVARKSAAAATQPLSLPEDVVTLSSSPKGILSEKKASQPVSSEEKKALLHPNTSRTSFSVYG